VVSRNPTAKKTAMTHGVTYRWTAAMLRSLRRCLDDRGFVEILPAILSERYEPGARHSVAVLGDQALPEIYKEVAAENLVVVRGIGHYYLPVSHAVEKQLSLEHLERVYCVAPCVRLVMTGEEKTGRHLCTFFQFEIEWRTEDVEEVFTLGEDLLATVAGQLLADGQLAKDPTAADRLRILMRRPYPRITFENAIQAARDGASATSSDAAPTADLTREEEERLGQQYDRPFWIWQYPEGVRDSLYRRNSDGRYDTYDIMLPLGHGELATGGCRPESSAEIIRQSTALGRALHPSYADWKARTGVQSAGFGIGLERLVLFCSGASDISEIISYHDSGPNTKIWRRE
jgi:asparaginyl-tRNA synthetase